ncbi:hypothetical protein [Streptomyces sp. NPDC056844]
MNVFTVRPLLDTTTTARRATALSAPQILTLLLAVPKARRAWGAAW